MALLRGGTGHGAETEVEGAAAVLRNLAGVQDGECHRTIVQAGAITPLVALLSNGTEQQAKQAMRALQAWAVVAEFQLAMMESFPELVRLEHDGDEPQKKHAAAVLSKVAAGCSHEVRSALESAGYTPMVAGHA